MKQQSERLASGLNLKLVNDLNSPLDKKRQVKELSKRAYKNLLYGYLRPHLPSYLILYVNNICQLRCDMCFYWDSMQKKTIQLKKKMKKKNRK